MAGFEAMYFSIGTLSGVCYGDITPVSGVARMLALLEGMTGLFYLAVLISRLVSLYSSDKLLKNDGRQSNGSSENLPAERSSKNVTAY
jgi:hypothetical protein